MSLSALAGGRCAPIEDEPRRGPHPSSGFARKNREPWLQASRQKLMKGEHIYVPI